MLNTEHFQIQGRIPMRELKWQMLLCSQSSWLWAQQLNMRWWSFHKCGACSSHCSGSLLNTVYSNQKRPKRVLFKQCYSEHSHNIWTEICNRLLTPIFQPICTKLFYFISWKYKFIYLSSKRDKDWEVFGRQLKIMSWQHGW